MGSVRLPTANQMSQVSALYKQLMIRAYNIVLRVFKYLLVQLRMPHEAIQCSHHRNGEQCGDTSVADVSFIASSP